MTLLQRRLCACAALVPLAFSTHAAALDPSAAAAEVPAAMYDSAFTTYRPASEPAATPDKGWRVANDAVAAKPGEDHMMGMQMNQPMRMPMPGKADAPAPMGKTMVMPDGSTMPMGDHHSMPMNKEMKMPMDKGMNMPMDKKMTMPMGEHHSMPMDKPMKMPAPKKDKSAVVPKELPKPMERDKKPPMSHGDAAMPGMDMSHDAPGKGH